MSLQDSLNTLLGNAVSNGDVPGVVAAITDRDGNIYDGGFGERVLGSGVAMTPDTVVWIASMTKAVTGAAAMQLVEQGKLDLDAPAGNVVSHLGEVEVLEGFDDNGQPKLRAPKRPVTLRHLLTHTAGYAYEIWDGSIVKYQEAKHHFCECNASTCFCACSHKNTVLGTPSMPPAPSAETLGMPLQSTTAEVKKGCNIYMNTPCADSSETPTQVMSEESTATKQISD